MKTLIKINTYIYILFIFFLPFTAFGQMYKYIGVWSQNGSLIFLFFGILLNSIIYYLEYKTLKINRYVITFIIFIIAMYISTLIMSIYFYYFNIVNDIKIIKDSIFKLHTLAWILLSFYYVYSYIQTKKDIIVTLKTLLVSLLFLVFYGYIQIYSIYNSESMVFNIYMKLQKILNYSWIEMVEGYNLIPQILLHKRVILTNQEPSITAYALQTIFFPFLIASIIFKTSIFKDHYMANILLFIITLPILIFTFSSAGFIVLVIQLVIFSILIFYFDSTNIKRKIYILLITFFLMLIVFIFMTTQTFRINLEVALKKILMSGSGEGSAATRYGTIIAGIKEFIDFPVFGVGLGNSKYFLANYIPQWALNSELITYIQTKFALVPRSLWVRILCETGIFGTIPLVYFIVTLTRSYIFELKKSNNKFVLFLVCSYIIYIISFFFHGFNLVAFFLVFQWAMLGFFVSAIDIIHHEAKPGIKT